VPGGDIGAGSQERAPRRAGLRIALARLAAAGVGLVSTRVALFSVELTEERERLARRLALIAVGGLLLAFAALFAGAFVIALFWDTHRLAAIAGVAVAHLAVGAFLLSKARAMGRDAPGAFHASLEELRKDRSALERALADPVE
jgi:uncharacterized membrane protein YqjE